MIPVTGWALVASCLMATGPECSGYLATGLVWNDQAKCESERRLEDIPGAQCLEIVGVREPDDEGSAPAVEATVRMLDEGVRNGLR